MNSQGIGTNSVTSWYRNLESSPLPDDDKLSVEAFVDQVYEKIEAETGTDFMNNEGAALYRFFSDVCHVAFKMSFGSRCIKAVLDLLAILR